MWVLEEAKKDYLLKRKIKKAKKVKRVCESCSFSTWRRAGMDHVLWCCVKEDVLLLQFVKAKFCRYYTKNKSR